MDFFDFSGVKDANEFSIIPEGEYHVVVKDQQWGQSQAGNKKLDFQMEILSGDYSGAEIYDTLTFTERGASRAKFVFSRLGDIDVHGPVNLNTVSLVGKQAMAKVGVEKSNDPRYSDKNKVAFTGYHRPDGFAYLPWSGGNGTSAAAAAPPVPFAQASRPSAAPAPPTAVPAPPAAAPHLSPDGKWMLVNGGWQPVPVGAPPTPPPPPPSTAPGQFEAGLRDDGLPF